MRRRTEQNRISNIYWNHQVQTSHDLWNLDRERTTNGNIDTEQHIFFEFIFFISILWRRNGWRNGRVVFSVNCELLHITIGGLSWHLTHFHAHHAKILRKSYFNGKKSRGKHMAPTRWSDTFRTKANKQMDSHSQHHHHSIHSFIHHSHIPHHLFLLQPFNFREVIV